MIFGSPEHELESVSPRSTISLSEMQVSSDSTVSPTEPSPPIHKRKRKKKRKKAKTKEVAEQVKPNSKAAWASSNTIADPSAYDRTRVNRVARGRANVNDSGASGFKLSQRPPAFSTFQISSHSDMSVDPSGASSRATMNSSSSTAASLISSGLQVQSLA